MSYDKDQKSRVVVFDIETVTETDNPKGCFNAMTGRIVSIAMLIDNGYELQPVVLCDPDERKILEGFWANLTRDDYVVGHNCLDFDLKFLKQRSWILNVKPSVDISLRKYWIDDVFDVMAVWTNWGYKDQLKGAGLDNIAQALGLSGKTGHGSEVAGLWANKQYKALMDYNLADTLITYQCYCRMTYRQPLALPVAQGVALPTFFPGEARERVPVPMPAQASLSNTFDRQQKGPQALRTLDAPIANISQPSVPQPSNASGFAPSFEGAKSDKPRQPVFYQQKGTEVILSGKGIFTVKRPLKEIYRAWGEKVSAPEERPQRFVWHLRSEKFQEFAGYCQNVGVPLQAMGDGATRIRREA